MGWASYREDIVSRFAGAARTSGPRHARANRKQAKLAPTSPRRNEDGQMSKLKEFTVSSARPLPVIVVADVSGSMGTDGKIEALNAAVAEMLSAFAEEED